MAETLALMLLGPDVYTLSYQVLYWGFVISLALVFSLRDSISGRSLGKLICGVTVHDVESYKPISWRQSFMRNLAILFPVIPLIALVQMSKGPRVGDGWAGTRVIWNKYVDHPVFTGAPMPTVAVDAEFLDANPDIAPVQSDNPFEAPRS